MAAGGRARPPYGGRTVPTPLTWDVTLRALCVGRHRFLAEHFCAFFRPLGVEAHPAVGLEGAIAEARGRALDLVVCEYDLLASLPLEAWERDEVLSRIPVVAVSLTRRPEEINVLDVNGIVGFLYLPTLVREDAERVLDAVRRSVPYSVPLPGAHRHAVRA